MEDNDWQLMRYFLLGLVLPSMVALSFHKNFRRWGKNCKKTCYKFFAINSFALLLSSRFNLHVYLRLVCQTTIIEMLSLIRKEKVTVKIVVTKLQETILCGTRRVVLLVHYVVPNVPISSQSPKTIWITILLRSTAPRKLISPSSVNFAFKSFQDFTLYVNIETRNTECSFDQKQEMWMWDK